MTRFLFILLLFVTNLRTFGQSSVSLGPEISLASNFSKSSKPGFGGSIDYTNKFSNHLGARVTVGYDYFKGKYLSDHVSFLPIRAGIQAFPADLIFLFAEAGIANFHDSNNTSETGFSYGLGAGYRIPLAKQYVQLSADYNYFRFSEVLNYTWFGFRLAYGLSLPRNK